jgi:hypothetical protein
MPYAVTSATTKPTRAFAVGERTFSYLTIQRIAYTGYAPAQRSDCYTCARTARGISGRACSGFATWRN